MSNWNKKLFNYINFSIKIFFRLFNEYYLESYEFFFLSLTAYKKLRMINLNK